MDLSPEDVKPLRISGGRAQINDHISLTPGPALPMKMPLHLCTATAAAASRRKAIVNMHSDFEDNQLLAAAAAVVGAASPTFECPSLSDLLMSSEEEDLLL